MNYIKYIKLNGEKEYKISEDGTTLLDRHMPSQGSDFWHTTTVSSRNKILSLRANNTGNNVECLLEDGKWYHIGGHGGLTLTVEELNKRHQEKETYDEVTNAHLHEDKGENSHGNTILGSVVGAVGGTIASVKASYKEYKSIDDMSFLEDASKGLFERMQNNRSSSDDTPVDYYEMIFGEEEREREKREKEKEKKYKDTLTEVLVEFQGNEASLLLAFEHMYLRTDETIINACRSFCKKSSHSPKELEIWTDLFLGILAGNVHFSKEHVDIFAKHVEQEALGNNDNKAKKSRSKKAIVEDEDFQDNRSSETSPTISKQKVAKSNDTPKKTLDGEKYDDLKISGFEKEGDDNDLLKPKNMFDLTTKVKNKQISYYKNKWNDSMWKRDHEIKKNIKTEIVHIEEETIKILSCEEKLNKLKQEGKSTGFWGFGGSDEVNEVRSQMDDIKERISDYKDKLDEVLDDLEECEDNIKEYSDELYELTGNKKYAAIDKLDGKGIAIARQLQKSKIEPSKLRTIFGL